MSTPAMSGRPNGSLRALHEGFLAILPRIELHGRFHFRQLACPHRRADAVAEMVALAWRSYIRLAERGKDPADFPGALAAFAARAVNAGQRLCRQHQATDVLSPPAQRRHGFSVRQLPAASSQAADDSTGPPAASGMTPPDERAMFLLDFPAWLATRSERDQRVIRALMAGDRTGEVSRKYVLRPARVSQLRREFQRDWTRFCAGVGPPAA